MYKSLKGNFEITHKIGYKITKTINCILNFFTNILINYSLALPHFFLHLQKNENNEYFTSRYNYC